MGENKPCVVGVSWLVVWMISSVTSNFSTSYIQTESKLARVIDWKATLKVS
ncbi:MAG: hypothetical protein RR324_06740 [Cellulosilyticaceae bacterium]